MGPTQSPTAEPLSGWRLLPTDPGPAAESSGPSQEAWSALRSRLSLAGGHGVVGGGGTDDRARQAWAARGEAPELLWGWQQGTGFPVGTATTGLSTAVLPRQTPWRTWLARLTAQATLVKKGYKHQGRVGEERDSYGQSVVPPEP